jgi:hypothetical protein
MPKKAKKLRRKKKKVYRWKQADMEKAIEGVKKGWYTPYAAAARFNIPRSTLRRYLEKGNSSPKLGRKPVLPGVIEERIVKWVLARQQTYMCVRRSLANQKISSIMKKLRITFRNGKTIPSFNWWTGFLKRNPKISFRRPTKKETARQRAERAQIINLYFKKLFKVIADLKLTPDRIWNYDETKVPSELLERSRVLAAKGSANAPVNETTANKHVTALACISASGKVLAPAFIFQQPYPPDVLAGAPIKSLVVRTASGYITADTFTEYFDVILEQLPAKRPLLLIVDGHISHFSLKFLKKAKEENIHVFCFPSHLTHLLQPLDVTIFGPLKKKYLSLVEDWVDKNPRGKFGPKTLVSLYSTAWKAIFTSNNIKSSFRKSGIWPRNAQIVLRRLPPSKDDLISEPEPDLEEVDEILSIFDNDEMSTNEASDPPTSVSEDAAPETPTSNHTVNPSPVAPAPPKYVPKKLSNNLLTHDSIISQIEHDTATKIAKEREKQDRKRTREENKKKKEEQKAAKSKKPSKQVLSIFLFLKFLRKTESASRNLKMTQ